MLTIIAKLLKLLNSEQSPAQLALAVCFGLAAGLLPGFSLLFVILLVLVCLIRANLTLFLLTWGLFEGVAYLVDPALHALGYNLLTAESLQGLWTGFAQSAFWQLMAFNNTLLLGAAITVLAFWLPVYFLVYVLISQYRGKVKGIIDKLKIVQVIKGSKLFKIYMELGA